MKTMKMIITELTKKQDKAILLTQHYSVALLMWYLGFGVEVVQCISVVIVQFSLLFCHDNEQKSKKIYVFKNLMTRKPNGSHWAYISLLCFDDSIQILLNLPLLVMLRTNWNLEGFVCSHVLIISSFIEQCALQIIVSSQWSYQYVLTSMQLRDLHIIFNSMQDSVLLKKATSFIVTTSKPVNKGLVLHLI